MTPEWRRRLKEASDRHVRGLRLSISREMRQAVEEIERGAWDATFHAQRLTEILQLHYADTGRTFARLAREMIGPKDAARAAFAELTRALEAAEQRDDSILFGDRVAELIRSHAALRARQIAGTSQAILTEALEEAARQGLGEAAAARLIRQRLAEDAISVARARMIARTEIGAAQNAGMIGAAEQLGIRVIKTWVAIQDGRTRTSHSLVDGKTILPGQKFEVGDAQLEYPGDPNGPPEEIINCRCTMFLEQSQ
ncbi:MAG: phage minor head protein [Hyphomonadaceae bacterium]|nr:phage minor head protein [Hyphomonadaceae bacterium]